MTNSCSVKWRRRSAHCASQSRTKAKAFGTLMKKYVVKKPRRSRAQDMSDKKQSRLRRARRARAKIRELGVNRLAVHRTPRDRKSTRLNSSHVAISYAVF